MRVALWVVTLLRIALIPVFLHFALRAQELASAGVDVRPLRWAALAVLVAMGSSDLLDGWIARRFDLATQLGAIVDAVADKLVQVTLVAFFVLSQGPAYAQLPLWFLALLVGRDVLLGGGLVLAGARNVPIRVVHRPHGKATSSFVFAILAWLALGLPHAAVTPLVLFGALLVTASAASYFRDGLTQARRALRRTP